jgi:hypothetical protein
MYVFRAAADGRVSREGLVRSTSPFVRGGDAILRLPGLAAGSYLVLPCTFEPGEHAGRFRLAATDEPGGPPPSLTLLSSADSPFGPFPAAAGGWGGGAGGDPYSLPGADSANLFNGGYGGGGAGGGGSGGSRWPMSTPPRPPPGGYGAGGLTSGQNGFDRGLTSGQNEWAFASEQEALEVAVALSLSEAAGGAGPAQADRRY